MALTITMKQFPIVCPNNGKPSVFKIHFGKKYLIWKGKSLKQSVEFVAKSIRAAKNKGSVDETNHLYHVYNHINKYRVQGATVEVCFNDYVDERTNKIDSLKMLKDEQVLIDEAIEDNMCLNNSVQAYVPENISYISESVKQKFLVWYEKRNKK